MQVCNSSQTTAPTPHHSVFLQAGCPSCRPTNSVKALKERLHNLLLDYNYTTTVLRPYVLDYLAQPVPEETFTDAHLSLTSTILYQLPPPTMIHSIFPLQLTCLTVFCTTYLQVLFGLPLGRNPPLHITFLHPIIIFFSQHMPIPLQPVLL